MLSPLFVVGVTRGCNSHIFSNSTHIQSHADTQRETNSHSNSPHFSFIAFSFAHLLFSLLFYSLSLVKLANCISVYCVYLWMQSEIGICFEERNATSQVQTQAQAHKNMLLYKRFFYGKVSIQWKSMQRPFQSTINEIFVYVWTLNLAQTK